MAPALTEPISPTKKLTSTAATASASPATRSSSRKLDPKNLKSNTKRNCSSSIVKSQPISSPLRSTRSKDTQQQRQISNSNSLPDTITTATETKFNDTLAGKAAVQEKCTTAQLLADLTNEAITAEICLRNQLKDVNLVKVSEGNSSPLQQTNDIVVLKAVVAVCPPKVTVEIKEDTAHMEAQSSELESKTSPVQKNQNKDLGVKLVDSCQSDIAQKQLQKIQSNENDVTKTDESAKCSKINLQDADTLATVSSQKESSNSESVKPLQSAETKVHVDMASVSMQKSAVGTTEFNSDGKRDVHGTTKREVHEVQELPPVSTDSTMTASEVEDNLEERLSQLDGTAISSPLPSQDIDRDRTLKESDNVNSCTAASPCTPIRQQALSQELQHIQNATPLVHLQQPQQNCLTPQSATSSINTIGSGNIPQSFLREPEGGSELEDQDIEEVFKVLKGFEGGTSSDLNVCDLNVLFNEVYMKMNETDIGSHSASGSVSVGQNNASVANPSIQLVKPTELEESQLDIEKRQQQMQRKIDFLMRRLRKQQSRYMCKQTSEEIVGLFEWSSRQANKGFTHNTHTGMSSSVVGGAQDSSKHFLKVIAARPPASDWTAAQEVSVPETQISSLLRNIESVANAQQLRITPAINLSNLAKPRKSKKALNDAPTSSSSYLLGKSTSTFSSGRAEDVIVPTLDENVTDELTQVAGLLQSEMCEVQRSIDSDATESSSGGESADEMVTYNNQKQQSLPITKRAAWRYSRDRAAIASRWSWLLSQISDLEIKIRQHSDLHQEIVRTKGPVICQKENDLQKDAATIDDSDKEEVGGSCRTRALLTTQFRKRQLMQTTNIHTISKKAARPSTIKCSCQWPLHPCALCTGRLDPTVPRDLPDTMMMSDRIALLDSGYHPVLSFKDNVNNALHFEAISKQYEWQQRVMRCQVKSIAKNVWKAEREALSAASSGQNSSSSKKGNLNAPAKRRYIRKKDRVINDDKSVISAGPPSSTAMRTDAATLHASSVSSSNEAGNGTATLTTTSTKPLVANKVTVKSAKNQSCLLECKNMLKEPSASLPVTTSSTLIHQTSNCPPTNYDQYNLNQTPSSLISNNKSNKIRKNSSASVAAYSHQYNHYHNNNNNNSHLYNGESNYYTIGQDWAAGSIDGTAAARSRTSSPTYGIGSSNYHKHDRFFDRKNRTSYDIDNIVIPYSVAAATRVEILPYKEIPTPKWRFVEIEAEGKTNNLDVSDEEDTINPSIANGHASENELLSHPTSVENLGIKSESNIDGIKKEKDKNDDEKEYYKTTARIICEKGGSDGNINNGVVEKNEANNMVPTDEKKDENINEPDSKKIKIEPNVIKSTYIEPSYYEVELSEYVVEDISDEAMFMRHERALAEERRKFQTYLKFPWSTRSRANRRIDSRAESSGANTPDLSSPASLTPCVGGVDHESIPSASNRSTPQTPLDANSETGDNSSSFLGVGLPSSCLSKQRQQRRRTTSTKRDRELDRRSSTPDLKELIPPYEPMKFPLSDEKFEELMRAMPLEHSTESTRFDECYLPSGGVTGKSVRCAYGGGGYALKRSSRSSTLCSGDRRIKGSCKNISTDDAPVNGSDFIYDEDYDDYPKHHLAPNDDQNHHLTADNCIDPGDCDDGENGGVYGASYEIFSRTQINRRNRESDGESTETEPFQDDDPNDPEWRGESRDRSRKKV